MDSAQRERLIAQYEDGYLAVTDALQGMSAAEWGAREAPGEWSPREIVHHLADSEMTSAIRLRLLIAQDAPAIVGYDQEAFVANLFPDRPVEPSLAAVAAPPKPMSRRRGTVGVSIATPMMLGAVSPGERSARRG